MMMIRIAQREEVEAVAALYRGFNRPSDPALELSVLAHRFDEIRRCGYIAVAVFDGELVGTYSMYFCPSLAHGGRPFAIVENVIVSSHARRRGLGRALMLHAQSNARENNCYKVTLTTGAHHARNLAFYQACGFVGDKVGFQVRYEA